MYLRTVVSVWLMLLTLNSANGAKAFNRATVLFTVGKVLLVQSDKHITLHRGMILKEGAVITTGKRSLALIRIVNKDNSISTTIKLTENSRLKIRIDRKIPMAHLSIGAVVVKVFSKHKTNKSLKFKVQSRIAAIGVRGTEFFVFADQGDKQVATVKEGHLEMVAKQGSHPIEMYDGFTTLTNVNQQLINPRVYKWQKQINWEMEPEKGSLFQPKSLWNSVRKTWEQYKQEQEAKFREYKREQQKKFNSWKENNDKLKRKIFGQ